MSKSKKYTFIKSNILLHFVTLSKYIIYITWYEYLIYMIIYITIHNSNKVIIKITYINIYI